MKTTIDIAKALLDEARRQADRRGTTMRALVEEGLRRVLKEGARPGTFSLRKVTFKGRGLHGDVADAGWDEIRRRIYEERGG